MLGDLIVRATGGPPVTRFFKGVDMKFLVTDRLTIESGLLVRSAYIVISIHDPDKPKPRVKKQSGLRAVLQLAFHDAEPAVSRVLPERIKLMTAEQAGQIRAFEEKHKDEVGAVVVHCEQGMSRSPAVAAALCKRMGGDDREFWEGYQPNGYVYRMVLEGGEKRIVS